MRTGPDSKKITCVLVEFAYAKFHRAVTLAKVPAAEYRCLVLC